MSDTPYIKAGLMAFALLIGFIISWEIYLRLAGHEISYNDDEALWAYHRQRIDQAGDANPVLVGSSRLKFGIDLYSWEAVTGALPTQLSLVGTSPRPLLADLANDPEFKGTVLVGVTEGLFFTPSGSFPEKQAQKCVAFYPKWSIAQKGGFAINHVLEPHLLFLDEERFSLRGLLKQLAINNRPGVFALPPFPLKFTKVDFNRQTSMTDEFVADTSMQNQMKGVWRYVANNAPSGPMPDSVLTTVFEEVKENVVQIQERGGKVIFVRMPSTGPVREGERKAFPREQYWDRLIRESGAIGIHFEDYPELSKYDCPEWSHLSPQDAKTFTKDLIKIIRQQAS